MRAYRLHSGGETRLVDVEDPVAGPGQVLLRVLATGVCHSDLNVRAGAAGGGWALPYTLGHEVCGEVVALGAGVTGLEPDEQVLVHGPAGCGTCRRCAVGEENLCDRRSGRAFGVGLGIDGGMADLLVTDARRLVPAAGLDPVAAAPLTDAALTSLHAVTRCQRLDEPGSVAVVVGVGGLGHVAVQLLRALTPATVVAVDTRPSALDLASRCGAHHVVRTGQDAGTDVGRTVRAVTDGRGADAVLDFVVTTATATLSAELLAAGADLVLVGGGGGRLEIGKPGPLPPDTRISLPTWGTRPELARLVGLARDGVLRTETTTYALAEADTAFAELERGAVSGRAVLVP